MAQSIIIAVDKAKLFTVACKIEDKAIPEDWTGLKICKLGVGGSLIVANNVSIPGECFSKNFRVFE